MKIFFLLLLLPSMANSQEIDTAGARTVTNKFLSAALIADMPEASSVFKEICFPNIKDIGIINSYTELGSFLIKTDTNNIIGYKRLLLITSPSKAGTPMSIRYMIISFKDKSTGKWKILEFREAVNTADEADPARGLSISETYKAQYKYGGKAYWQMLNGDLAKSYKSFLLSIEESKKDKDEEYAAIAAHKLDILKLIIGK